jgi:hypothetical protein
VIVTIEQLKQECAKYGTVMELRILADFATGISRGQVNIGEFIGGSKKGSKARKKYWGYAYLIW